jgi:hypothetical protein
MVKIHDSYREVPSLNVGPQAIYSESVFRGVHKYIYCNIRIFFQNRPWKVLWKLNNILIFRCKYST